MSERFKYKSNTTFYVVGIIALAVAVGCLSVKVLIWQLQLSGKIVLSSVGFVCLVISIVFLFSNNITYAVIKEKALYVRKDLLLPDYSKYSLKDIAGVHLFGANICIEYTNGMLSKDISLEELNVRDAEHIYKRLTESITVNMS